MADKIRASEWVKQKRAEKAAQQAPKAPIQKSPSQGGNFGRDYSSGASVTVVFIALFVYVTMVIARGNGKTFLDAIETEKEMLKFMGAFVLLSITLGLFGPIGRGLLYLIVVGGLLKIGPEAAKNGNKMIQNLFSKNEV